MKKLLLIVALFGSCSLNAMRTKFKLWTANTHDASIPYLNLDIEQFKMHKVDAGTYRLVTDAGVTNKYVKFPVDGAIQQNWSDYTCLYIKNNENRLDKIGCMDTKKIMNPHSVEIS